MTTKKTTADVATNGFLRDLKLIIGVIAPFVVLNYFVVQMLVRASILELKNELSGKYAIAAVVVSRDEYNIRQAETERRVLALEARIMSDDRRRNWADREK